MHATTSSPHPSGVAVMDEVPDPDPVQPRTSLEQDQLPHVSYILFSQPRGSPASPAPSFPFVDLPTSSGVSDTTCQSPTITPCKPITTENVVRLSPISDHPIRPALRMHIFFCEASQMFLLQTPYGRETRLTMGEILQRYSTQVAAIDLDATAIPNPTDLKTMACTVDLPFTPHAVASEAQTYPHHSGHSYPVLSTLLDLNITTSRAPSIGTLLGFLQYTPLLKTISITNLRDHQAVLPDDVAKVAAPNLPRLDHVLIDGLLTNTIEQLLHKLLPSIKHRTTLDVHLHTPSFPAFSHDAVMNTLFASLRHLNLSYIALSNGEPELGTGGKAYMSYLFSLSDDAGRVNLNWHWTEERGARPYLGHIGLVTRALARVRTISLALYNVHPSASDLRQVLHSFSALARVDVHITHTHTQPDSDSAARPTSASTAPPSATSPSTEAASATQSASDPRPLAAAAAAATTSQHAIFSVRAAHVVRRVANLPTLFALGLAQHVSDSEPMPIPDVHHRQTSTDARRKDGGEREGRLVSRLARAWYRPLWALMVRKPASHAPRGSGTLGTKTGMT